MSNFIRKSADIITKRREVLVRYE